jgi:hypothetical protein
MFSVEYAAEPYASMFHNSPEFVRAIMGPIGSGKSVACFQEIFRNGLEQEPGKDGIKRTRWAVIRNTYPELKSTSIKTFEDWFGPIAKIKYDSPIVATIQFEGFYQEILFLSMDRPQDVKKLLSLELTGGFINEAREISKTVLDALTGRVGRYPAKKDGGPSRSCIILDTNPPDDDHWWYQLFEEERPKGYRLIKQPGALIPITTERGTKYLPNPKCENVKHQPLGYEYWMRLIPGKKEEWIKVYVLGEYGSSLDGRPCYPTYKDSVHCASETLAVYEGLPLLLGWDYGRTPACVIGQMSPKGQLRIVDELLVDPEGQGMGIRNFTRQVVKPYLAANYPGFSVIYSWGDPSGIAKGYDEESVFDIQAQEGIFTEPAHTNEPNARLENVEYFLSSMSDGAPGFILDPKCKTLRKGFLGGYQFERLQVAGDVRFKDRPKKNRYSHVHDACQYLADLARHGVTSARTRSKALPIQTSEISALGWT